MPDYLNIMSHPNSYAGYIEIAAAQHLYHIIINVVVSGTVLPPTPNPPVNNLLYVKYDPQCHALFHPRPEVTAAYYVGQYSCVTCLN